MRGPRVFADEKGASAVEFALVLSLFVMLLLGIFTGGIAFNRQHGMTHASREAVRFAATFPTGTGGVSSTWFEEVTSRAIQSAYGELDLGTPGRYICVAYVGNGSPLASNEDWTSKSEVIGDAPPAYSSGWCFDDGRGASNLTERRVQVMTHRDSDFDALFISQVVNLGSDAVARYEAVSP